ncbi:protein yellow [Drosophila biarmipes]|uniref:protein yellow n=1 Tax=Drosophila biarmipes TaxID=125945 RepID=UPI0007E7F4C2|nr:protein yellow [Drosophila biarmipes]XP_016965614.1 protein yellow [Drosophila biarmipes]
MLRFTHGLLLLWAASALGNDNLRVAYEWREMDFEYASPDQRWSAIERGEFKPANVIPFGLEVAGHRLFVTLPRWRSGVPASLAYLDLNDTSSKSPVLKPFPSWQAHNFQEDDAELVSPFRVRADRCGRLWVLDSRISGVLEQTKIYGAAQLLVYDLHNDDLLRRHVFPLGQLKQGSLLANLAVEDSDCENTFAYAADLGNPSLLVYSWKDQESWRVQHHFFHPDPLAGNFSINGIEFQWDDGLYGLALSKPLESGYSTLYFHPLCSTTEFSVDTAILRNKTLATSTMIYREFKVLGSRGPNTQAGAEFLDPASGVLFYALPNLNEVACWRTATEFKHSSQSRIFMSNDSLVFPSDIKVDDQQRLWVLSNQLPVFIYDELYPGSINFRILTASVKDAIENTACEIRTSPLPDVINKLGDILNTNIKVKTNSAESLGSLRSLMMVGLCFLMSFRI